jgi:hypothetical protein
VALLGADDECLAGCVDQVGGDVVEPVDVAESTDLGHDAFDEPEVAAGDAGDRVDQVPIRVQVVDRESELVPVVGQDGRDVFRIDRLIQVGETDAAVQLGVPGKLPVEPRHADEDDAYVGAVEEVLDLFQSVGLEPFGLVDDQQLGTAGVVRVPVQLGVVVRPLEPLDVVARACRPDAAGRRTAPGR